MHDVLPVAVTVATIIAAAFLTNQAVSNLRSDMMARFDSIQKDMRDLYVEQARQDLRVANLEQHR